MDSPIYNSTVDDKVSRPRPNHQIVKRIGNYPNLIYRLMLLLKTGKFSIQEYWDYLSSDERYCDQLVFDNFFNNGGLGQLADLTVCETDSEEKKCFSVDQLMVSFNKNGSFNVFSQPTVVKNNKIDQTIFLPVEVISIEQQGQEKLKNLAIQTISDHYQVPQALMESITSILVNLIYDNGQSPHLTRSFGVYHCQQQLKLIMEKIEGPTIRSLLPTFPLEMIDSILTQALIASFSMYYHGGMLHVDAHPKNYLITPLSPENKNQRFYAGQDLYQKRYLVYTNLPEEIFGAEQLVIDSQGQLVKLIDYDKVITDLSKANNTHLKAQAKFSNLGERLVNKGYNFISVMIERYQKKATNFRGSDLIANVANDYFTGQNYSGPFFHFLHRMLYESKQVNLELYNKLKIKLYRMMDKIGLERENLIKRSPYSRAGPGRFENCLSGFLSVFSKTISYRQKDIKFVGSKFDPTLYQEGLIINWKGLYKDTIFKSLDYLSQSLSCIDNCQEINLNQKRFNPDFSYTDSLSLSPVESFFNNDRYQVYLYRDFPEQLSQNYLYTKDSKSPSELQWPSNLVDSYIRGIYAINVMPKKSRVEIIRNVDLMRAADSTTQNCMVVSGAYFLVAANLDNQLGNIQDGSKIGDPLGISYFDGKTFVNPFPPAYDPYLVYVCIDVQGKHWLFNNDQVLAMSGFDLRPFRYCLEDDTILVRNVKIPRLSVLAEKYQYKYIYQTGPILHKSNFLFSEQQYQQQFTITEDDLQHSDQTDTNLIGKKYSVYVNPEGQGKNYQMFTRPNKTVPSLYAMNVSDVFVNRNVLLYYLDGSYQFLIVAGRGFGAEGIDNAQLARIIYNTPELSDHLLYACCLDGGFSANVLIKENGDYLYGLEDPERRMVGFAYVFS